MIKGRVNYLLIGFDERWNHNSIHIPDDIKIHKPKSDSGTRKNSYACSR